MKLAALLLWAGLPTTHASPTLASLARDVSRVESIRTIKNLQRQFSQLAQFGRHAAMASLFSRNSTLTWGNSTAHGPSAIASWIRDDAGAMNGVSPGSLDTLVAENPVVSLSVDGRSAKARWNGLRFSGNGAGGAKIQGGIYENEYELSSDGAWEISSLHYHALYAGPYIGGWRNVGGPLPFVPYHFTPESSGVPIPVPEGEARETNATVEDLARRIAGLNDEDEVRNLMHAHGFYVDRRMWTDVVELHTADTTVTLEGAGTYTGHAGVRQVLERFQGPEGLTQGINNDHPIFDMIVTVDTNGVGATARGIEIAMLGDANTRTASWQFNVFRTRFAKEDGTWKVQDLHITPLIAADYYEGWGNGGLNEPNTYMPPFLNLTQPQFTSTGVQRRATTTDLSDLQRRLSRSAAFDGAENQSHAYGYFIDDLDCGKMGQLFAARGHKASPFAGYFISPNRTATACYTTYGYNRTALRSSISFHWRPQPVILVSEDGRSATLRARLLQPSTSVTKAGSFNNAIYHDQMVLEDGKWRLWSVTIDEFYWQSSSWEGGWSAAVPRNSSEPDPAPADWIKKYPPDITLRDVGERESTFRGGSGHYIQWPEIQRMWFQYRNLVTGRVPEFYWPGCVPCRARPDWALEANGYQEPPTGPVAGNGTVSR